MKWSQRSLYGIIAFSLILIIWGWKGQDELLAGMANSWGMVMVAGVIYFAYLLWKSWRGY